MLNISDKNWDKEDDLSSFLLFDQFIYARRDDLFDKYFKNKIFCDTDGELYKVTNKKPPSEAWRKWLGFLPNVYKVTLTIKREDKKIDIEELRRFVLDRLSQIESNDFVKKWIENVRQAKNHEEIINGEIK